MADKKKTTKKERAEGFWNNHKKSCIFAILVLIAAGSYILFDIDLNIDSLTDVVCGWIGGC